MLNDFVGRIMRAENDRLEKEAKALMTMGFSPEELTIVSHAFGEYPPYVTVKPPAPEK